MIYDFFKINLKAIALFFKFKYQTLLNNYFKSKHKDCRIKYDSLFI